MEDTTTTAAPESTAPITDDNQTTETTEEEDFLPRFKRRMLEKEADEREEGEKRGKSTDEPETPDEPKEKRAVKSPESDDREADKGKGSPKEGKSEENEAKTDAMTFTAKVDGREVTVSVEKAYPELAELWPGLKEPQKKRLIDQYQQFLTARQRFDKVANDKKMLKAVFEKMKSDPLSIVRHPSLGIDRDKYREMLENELYENYVKLEAMDPKERENYELKHKLKTYEEQEKEKEQAKEAEREAQLTKAYGESLQKDIIAALEESGLPKAPITISMTARYMKMARERGYDMKQIKPAMMMDLVRKDFDGWFKQLYGNVEGEKLIDMLGKDAVKKISSAQVAKFQEKKAEVKPATGEPSQYKRKRKPMGMAEWKEKMRAIKYGH